MGTRNRSPHRHPYHLSAGRAPGCVGDAEGATPEFAITFATKDGITVKVKGSNLLALLRTDMADLWAIWKKNKDDVADVAKVISCYTFLLFYR